MLTSLLILGLARMRCALRDRAGVAVIEAALLAPLLIILGLGTVDVSRLILQSRHIDQGLVAAGTYLSKSRTPDALVNEAQHLAVSGSPYGTTSRVAGWEARDVSIRFRDVPNPGGQYRAGDTVRVVELSTAHEYRSLGILELAGLNPITLRSTYQERLK